ncbi:MAG TPA: hypothetical protein VIM48_01760 [Chthoniobacterales bacterium]
MRRIIPLLVLLVLSGCATVQQPAFQPATTSRALVNWKHGGESLTADVVFQKGSDGAIRILVSKEALLFTLTRSDGIWVAAGPLAHGGWRGRASAAPAVLRDWICFAEAVEQASAMPKGGMAQTDQYSLQFTKRNGAIKELGVGVLATRDRFRAIF